ncbi:MAG: spermidine/putrescine ABC transporter substrate-binding protein [Rhodoluna sp.]
MRDPNSLPQDPMMAELVKMSRRQQLTRRTALAGAAGLGTAIGLAACAPASEPTATEAPVAAQDLSDTEKIVVWDNWTEYMDLSEDETSRPTLERFEAQTGIKVEYLETYLDNDEYYAIVKDQLALGQDIGVDLVCPTEWMAARWVGNGYSQRLDAANIPNKANLAPAYLGASYDPNRDFTIPYQGILGGIAYNKELYRELTGKEAPQTVDDLWADELNGRVVVLSEMRDTVGLMALAEGIDIASESSFTEDAYMNIIDKVQGLYADGKIRNIEGNEYTKGFRNGDYVAGIVWSGDVVQMNFSKKTRDMFGFFLPESGGTISSDVFTVPIGATHKKNAEALINYYYDPVNAAELAAWVNYITPVAGAYDEAIKLDPELAENNLIFPSEEFLSFTHAFRALNPEEEQTFATAWQRVLLGA